MKKFFGVMLVALFLALGAASAQAHCGKCGVGDAHPDMKAMAGEKLEMMTKDLNLTDEQKTKVEAIMKAKMEKKEAIMDEKSKAMEALHEDFKAQLKQVLNEEQLKKWEALKDKCPMCKEGKMCEMCMKKAQEAHPEPKE